MALTFCAMFLLGKEVSLGQRVIVIGGGNVAYDVARTVLRQEEYDVSRTAARMAGVRQVNLVCLESLDEMPADTVEILEGQEEGVSRHNSWGPREVLVNERNGQKFVRGVKFVRCARVYDENKRFAPKFDERRPLRSRATLFCSQWGSPLTLVLSTPSAMGSRCARRSRLSTIP